MFDNKVPTLQWKTYETNISKAKDGNLAEVVQHRDDRTSALDKASEANKDSAGFKTEDASDEEVAR